MHTNTHGHHVNAQSKDGAERELGDALLLDVVDVGGLEVEVRVGEVKTAGAVDHGRYAADQWHLLQQRALGVVRQVRDVELRHVPLRDDVAVQRHSVAGRDVPVQLLQLCASVSVTARRGRFWDE